ncbi:hypothetical protein Tco_1256797 [Tanacetum coccineum]
MSTAIRILKYSRELAKETWFQVNAPNYSRNSHKESYGSNDMVHAYFLEDARKMTQDKTRIPNHRDMASTRAHCTPNACTPKPRNIYRSSPVSKCSGGMSNGVPLVWICQKSLENSQKRTREWMSDQEAKEIEAKAREIMPQPSTKSTAASTVNLQSQHHSL